MRARLRAGASFLAGYALLFGAAAEGWLGLALSADPTGIVMLILSITVAGVALAQGMAARVDRGQTAPLWVVRQIASTCVALGFIGTIVGFILMLSSVDAESAGDVTQVASMVGAVISGMGVALYTTLAGCLGSLWLTLTAAVISRE